MRVADLRACAKDNPKLILRFERISLQEWQSTHRWLYSSSIAHLEILNVACPNTFLSDCANEFFAVKGNTNTAWSIRKDPPVMVRFTILSEAQCENALKLILLPIKPKKIRIILVVPGVWVQESNLFLRKQINE